MKERHRYLRRKTDRTRSSQRIGKLLHVPSGHGKGIWHSFKGLLRYKLARRKARLTAKASRRFNRLAAR